MAITCALFGPLREPVGEKHVDLDIDAPTTVGVVLERLVSQEPAIEDRVFTADRELRSLNVTLNGKHIQHLDGLDSVVADGDLIRMAPPVEGGRDPPPRR